MREKCWSNNCLVDAADSAAWVGIPVSAVFGDWVVVPEVARQPEMGYRITHCLSSTALVSPPGCGYPLGGCDQFVGDPPRLREYQFVTGFALPYSALRDVVKVVHVVAVGPRSGPART
jgi:hypothetical protein